MVNKNDFLYKKWNKEKGVFMYLLNRDAGMTSADIGVLFGGLDTIDSGKTCKRIRTEMEKDKRKWNEIVNIEKSYE